MEHASLRRGRQHLRYSLKNNNAAIAPDAEPHKAASKPMKIFHVISHFDVGGAERVATDISKSGNENAEYHIVELIRAHTPFTSVMLNEMRDSGIRYHRWIVPNLRFHYLFERLAAVLFPLWFLPLFLRHRPDVVHSHTEMPDLGVSLFFRLFPRLTRRCKVVRTIHNTRLWTGMARTGRWVEPFFIRQKANVAISETVRDNYAARYGSRPPIIYNGVAAVPQRHYEGVVSGKKNVLFAGRFEQQKGIDVLVAIIKRMKDDRQYHFHLIGDGSMRPWAEHELAGQHNVTFKPPVHGLSAYMRSFFCLLMPSEFEGLSILSLEAGANGLPQMISDVPGLRETVPGRWPLKVTSNAPEDYTGLLRDVLPSADMQKLSADTQAFAEKHFGVRLMQERYEKFYGLGI